MHSSLSGNVLSSLSFFFFCLYYLPQEERFSNRKKTDCKFVTFLEITPEVSGQLTKRKSGEREAPAGTYEMETLAYLEHMVCTFLQSSLPLLFVCLFVSIYFY